MMQRKTNFRERRQLISVELERYPMKETQISFLSATIRSGQIVFTLHDVITVKR